VINALCELLSLVTIGCDFLCSCQQRLAFED
jgi:hypothetical protein